MLMQPEPFRPTLTNLAQTRRFVVIFMKFETTGYRAIVHAVGQSTFAVSLYKANGELWSNTEWPIADVTRIDHFNEEAARVFLDTCAERPCSEQ